MLCRLALLLLFISCCVDSEIIQVQIIHRHGARDILDKHATDPQVENMQPTLYDQGVEQLKRLGSFINDKYLNPASPSQISNISPTNIQPRDIISKTSNFQRTQLSARAFLAGLYPDHFDEIPTLVFNGTETDWTLRGYALCPTVAEQFREFVNNDDEYKKKKDEHEEFVVGLARKLGFDDEDVNFENVFNVYDLYTIVQNGYDEEKYGDIEKLSDEEMKSLTEIADWYESRKYSFNTHKVHVAGGLLARMLNDAKQISQGADKSYGIVHYSAHYPTLLTLVGSLRSGNDETLKWPATKIPAFGAGLIVEVHREQDDIWVRLRWYDGGEGEAEVKSVAIGSGGTCGDADELCRFSDMEQLVRLGSFNEQRFCEECQSRTGVCSFLNEDGGDGEGLRASRGCSTGTKVGSGSIGVMVGVLIGVLLSVAYVMCQARRKSMRLHQAAEFDSQYQPHLFS